MTFTPVEIKEVEAMGTALTEKTISAKESPQKTPLLKKRSGEVCLKFATEHSENALDYLETVVGSKNIKIFHVWLCI